MWNPFVRPLPNKPKIFPYDGAWACSFGVWKTEFGCLSDGALGRGATPAAAYKDWKKRSKI